MRTITVAAAGVAIALAGCSKEPDKPKSPEEVRAEVAKAVKPVPGMYRTTITVAKVELPGMPPEMAERMKGMFGATGQSREFCLTEEDADKGFEEMNKRAGQGQCTYDRFSASGGTLDSKMTCKTAEGVTGTYEMKGSFTAYGSDLTMTMQQQAAALPGGGMRMEARVKNERVGDCT